MSGADGFPSVRRYLATLPDGADSYPASQCKGSVVLASLAELPSLSDAALLAMPPCVTALIESPPAVGSWTSTVHHNALLGVVYDARYTFGGGLVAFERAAFEKSRGLFGGPLYRVIFAILRVERLMRASERRWGIFHRGSTLVLERYEDGHCEVLLTYPPHLFSDIPRRSLAQGLRAAVTATRAKDCLVRHVVKSPTATLFEIDWKERSVATSLSQPPQPAGERRLISES